MIKPVEVNIDSSISKVASNISLGIITYKVQEITESSNDFKEKFASLKENLIDKYSTTKVTDQDEIKAWRVLLKQLKIDPSRYKVSSEALIKRTISDKPLFWVNAAVDINNFLSVLYATPMGIYDIDHIKGNILYGLGNDETSYDALNGRIVSMEGKPHLSDELGGFGSPIVDSQRTKVTMESKNLIHVLYFHPGIAHDEKSLIINKTAEIFAKELGSEVTSNKVIN
jgi:DNA/RNA-binding domain of Phe-tRNA-synthetase-like protein